MLTAAAILIGFVLDLLFGDPEWILHPVVIMGKYITFYQKHFRSLFPQTSTGALVSGGLMAASLMLLSFGIPFAVLQLLGKIHPVLRLVLESFWCFQIFAVKGLKEASMKVYRALEAGDLIAARQAVSMIVGRDTENLSEEGVTKAAVETVAENFSDGVIAPLFYLLLGGAPLGFLYKAVNTMDSMVGYKNEQYLYFGRIPAKTDDVFNFIPARLAALLLWLSAWVLKFDYRHAWTVFKRDRYQHKSPNSAQTESLCAGALDIELAGNASYFGKILEKPTIGDPIRPIEYEDIRRVNRMLYVGSAAGLMIGLLIRICWIMI